MTSSSCCARSRREELSAAGPADEASAAGPAGDEDDTLTLLFLCCHPALSEASQIAITLRAVGGLTTAQIASAFLMPEATMAQRISRAKQAIRSSGLRFAPPAPEQRPQRLRVVLHVLYLVFNEGYAASSGPEVQRVALAAEAIRLARLLHLLSPDGEVKGLLSLMLLTHARRRARVAADGSLVPLAEQDRALWDRAAIEEGTALISEALARAPLGPLPRVDAVRAHLLEMMGSQVEAAVAFARAARRTTSLAEQRYLESKASRARGGTRQTGLGPG